MAKGEQTDRLFVLVLFVILAVTSFWFGVGLHRHFRKERSHASPNAR